MLQSMGSQRVGHDLGWELVARRKSHMVGTFNPLPTHSPTSGLEVKSVANGQ